MLHKKAWLILLGMLLGGSLLWAASVEFRNAWSPRNQKRPLRPHTRYIILHTTEGPHKGSLAKLQRYGEAHYLVSPEGVIYRIINRQLVAMHAGRSMWEGLTNLDNHSIGIEVVGYHDRPISSAQKVALRELLRQLQAIYGVTDENVVPHSMVAYGTPNRWHKRSHRGRKRCGMQFADRELRQELGLSRQPLFDPDVRAGRLVNADPYLAKVLFGSAREQDVAREYIEGTRSQVIAPGRSAWDIARDQYRSSHTIYRFPDGREQRGNEITNWKGIPPGTRVVLSQDVAENAGDEMLIIGKDAASAEQIAGEEVLASTTIYFLTDGRVRQGSELTREQVGRLAEGTRMLVGYVHGGYVTPRRSAFDIAGAKWNQPETFYRFSDGRIESGEQVSENAIAPMTMVFFQH